MIVRLLVAACFALLAGCAAENRASAPAPLARSTQPPAPTQDASPRAPAYPPTVAAPRAGSAETAPSERVASSTPAIEPPQNREPATKPEVEAGPEPAARPQRELKPEPKPAAKPGPERRPEPERKPEPSSQPKPAAKPNPPVAAKPPAKPQASTSSAAPPSTQAAPKPPAPAPLDLKSLEERLKDTSAIGVLTKLSLKNQVDDLVGEFRAYHRGARPPTLSQLRPAFELLLMKVLSLLQDRDPTLAHDVNASRDAIWGVLTDPRKLAEFS